MPKSGMTSKMKCVFLVSCGRRKKSHAVPAKELYVSARFQRARISVEATGCLWFVISAEHGLLGPDEIIDPYDKTLKGAPPKARKEWAEKVKGQMDKHLPDGEIIVILAEEDYYKDLIPYLKERFAHVMIPEEECH